MWVNVFNQSQHYPSIIDKSEGDWTSTGTGKVHKGYILFNRDINSQGSGADDYRFMIGDGTSVSRIPDYVTLGSLKNAGWTHLVITVDSGTTASPKIKVYKNGVFLTSKNRLNVGDISTANNLVVGKWRLYGRYFNGSVDELSEYNRVLSPDEVLSHYQTSSIVNGSSPRILPVASFSANVTNGTAPLTVQFNDSSINATGWNWNFGDGGTSPDKNPIHTYYTAGNYTVNLTASNANETNSTSATITVLAQQPAKVLPVASFSANVTNGTAPLTVQFNDSSINATGWNWTFGDGNTSNVQNPIHTYYTAGNYTVNLTASNLNGTNSTFKNINVSSLPGNDSGYVGLWHMDEGTGTKVVDSSEN